MSDLGDIAAGDEGRARALREILVQLEGSSHAELREMARAVLDGELTLREAALSDAYGPALGQAFGAFWTRYCEMSPEERTHLASRAQDYLQRLDS
jgi:hypothetical protein